MKTDVGYKGTVKCKSANSTYTIHNKGTKRLFYVLSQLLTGNTSENSILPGFFMIYSKSVNDLVSNPTVQNFKDSESLITFVEAYATMDEDKLYFTGRIQPDQLNSNSSSIVSCALIDRNKENILAAIEFNSVYYDELTSGHPVNIGWNLSLDNMESVNG